MRELRCHLRVRHFGGVQSGVDPDDSLALDCQCLGGVAINPLPYLQDPEERN